MLTLKMYLIQGDEATQSASAENAIGSLKVREFKRIGVDSVEMKYLSGDKLKEFTLARKIVRYPYFELIKDDRFIAEMIGYPEYAVFLKWLKIEIANSKNQVHAVNVT